MASNRTNPRKRKAVLRFAFAKTAFLHAQAGTKILLSSNGEYTDLHHCLVAGIVTSYARPFMSANGLGRLPKMFDENLPILDGQFALQPVHEKLMEMRNKLYAHLDRGHLAKMTEDRPDSPALDDVLLEFSEAGSLSDIIWEVLPPIANFVLID